MAKSKQPDALALFHPPVRRWFEQAFAAPTLPQHKGWPAIARGGHTLLLAPTGTGKTLAAFLHCLDRLMFESPRPSERRLRVVYVSPLKALAVDVERNLRAPLQGIARMAAELGEPFRTPEVAIRTGDTPQKERARFSRDPAEILITTPESLFLMLTSNVRETLRSVDTVIIDEIHSLVPTKRGAHLALSLERLDAIAEQKIQRIGLSATQRPLDEVARFLGGVQTPGRARKRAADPDPETEIRDEFATHASVTYRPVEIVDAGIRKPLELTIEVPVEDMARLGEHIPATAPERDEPSRSIWSAIHPRLLELIRAHTSTLIFVNGRRGAERLAGALNELAGEVLVQAHHGSIAREQRQQIEENLKAGTVRGLVATSTLELGIDMGAIDLVVQIEAPPSVASGMQRIGRAGHSVGAPSRGVLFPKFRGDLVACAALTRAMQDGQVEATRYPRNPLDVLAQQLVAMCAVESWPVEDLYTAVRRAAPFAELSRPAFEGVLDMLSGRYPSDAFAELRPRLTWDRNAGTLTAREGAKRLAVANAGTIPDRGLYGVFLAGSEGKPGARVGELDEEMVFESKVGETFVLGASTWRIQEITHDRVLVTPAPGEPGRMPFWRGDAPTRPLELGLRIGALVRELGESSPRAATERLIRHHALSELAAKNLLAYLADQRAATSAVPDDRTILIERGRDEVGDWRVCVLSPLGGQVHAPWSMAVAAKIRAQLGAEPEILYTNDGFALRLPESDSPPDPQLFVPAPEELEKLVMDELGGTALFAARFREAAGRALLLPKRRPGGRTALWQQRKRAADLLAVASHHASFPMLLEAYRECLRDVFDMHALERTLSAIRAGRTRVEVADPPSPSPFASTLLFGFVANYIYEGDAPLAERRAQALAIDHAQLRELMGEAELRELLDPRDLHQLEAELQHLDPKRHARSLDAVHDLLLRLGDLSRAELAARTTGELDAWLAALERAQRIVRIQLAGEARFIAVEDAARFRDGADVELPQGLPAALLEPVADARGDLLARYGRTHGPFTASEVASRLGLPLGEVEVGLRARVDAGRLLEGAFRPTGTGAELCDPDVLRTLRARARARLRAEVEPVEPAVLGRFLSSWQGVSKPGRGREALLRAVEKLQGLPLPASVLESEILPARVDGYLTGDLDPLAASGEVIWRGVERLGERDGRVSLYLADSAAELIPPVELLDPQPDLDPREAKLLQLLAARGASFFNELHASIGGYAGALVEALWGLVWKGLVTNDTLSPLRAHVESAAHREKRERAMARGHRVARSAPPDASGRWSLWSARAGSPSTVTHWSARQARVLLERYGLVGREVARSEALPGGFGAVYPALKAMEDAGKVRRGFFVSGLGAAQFALPPVLDQLRGLREPPAQPEALLLAAVDPANPYGAVLPWPATDAGRPLQRAAGAHVVLVNGALAAFASKGARQVRLFLPESEPERTQAVEAVVSRLARLASGPGPFRAGMLVEELDGGPATEHPTASAFARAGFTPTAQGLQLRRAATWSLP
ncbi:MAG: DEAD/DEAH box helicase [Deltaproteobacteria bacterium]|nr:DEAD/DEAH box helicase [Deltaproteobacteria bacterium]